LREQEARLAELTRMADQAEKEGREDEARRLRAEVDALRRMIELGRAHPPGRPDGAPDGPGMGPPGGPGMPGGPGGRPPRPVNVSSEEREAAVQFLKEHEPQRFAKLTELRESRPQDYERLLTQVAMEVKELRMLKDVDPKRYERRLEQRKLEYRSSDLAERIHGMQQGAEQEEMKKELRGVLSRLFDVRESEKESEVDRLEEEMARLRETLKKRKEAKDSIVDRRMNDMLGEEDDLRW